ncbi:hypothetical protein [Streptomyces sp. AC602_WCS936]|uniref:hypothetical protein n=1 Tax=Streptomyces sp. AC602_WCS936 TaxID=2823685 RepID=UPI001C262F6C|nr:hypothetical protein [Streptomyces sp. AC602_WCS936]
MDAGFIAAEARRLGMCQFASSVDEYGATVLHESAVARESLIRIFEHRLRRAKVRDDGAAVRLVDELLSAFRSAESSEIKLIHLQAGKMEVMLYGEECCERILAIVILSEGDA